MKSQDYPRALHLPPAGRPRWVPPGASELELVYLSWGRRFYGVAPIPVSRHTGWQYALVNHGAPILEFSDSRLVSAVGQAFIIHPECASGWSDQGRAESELLTWTWRQPPAAATIAPPAGGFWKAAVDAPTRRALRHLHRKTRAEVQDSDSLTPLALRALQVEIDLTLARARPPAAGPVEPQIRLQLAEQWLAANLAHREPMAGLSEYLQLSAATVVRLFQRTRRTSPQEFHQRLRLEHAAELLAATDEPVKAVAYQLGYKHPHDFTRAFRRHYRVTPVEYRRQHSGVRA